MKKKVNWGIIALGGIADKFASDLQLVKDARLIAVASRDVRKSKLFADKHKADLAYDNYEELVNNPLIDIVYIASPHTFHYEHSMLCLKHNKNVLCEKPMGMNANQVKELSKFAKKHELFLMEALWTRFIPSYLKCKKLIENNQIGEIEAIQADFGFVSSNNPKGRILNKELGGGALLDIGIYPVFLAISLLGEPEEIAAKSIMGKTGVDLTTSILFKYLQKKATASLSTTITANTPIEAIISGSKGQITILKPWHTPTSIELVKDGKKKTFNFAEPGFGYEHEIKEVHYCLRKNWFESKLFSLTDSYTLHKTLDCIREKIDLKYSSDK